MIKLILTIVLLLVSLFGTTYAIAQEKGHTLEQHLKDAGQVEIEQMAQNKGEGYRFIFCDQASIPMDIVLITKDGTGITVNACSGMHRISLQNWIFGITVHHRRGAAIVRR